MKLDRKYTNQVPAGADRAQLDDLERRLTGSPDQTNTTPAPSLAELITEALSALAAAGLEHETLEIDQGWRRKKGADHLWYVADSGTGRTGRPWLIVVAGDAHRTNDVSTPIIVFKSWERDQEPLPPADRAAIEHQLEERKRQQAIEDQARREKAADQAAHLWDQATTEVNGHPYLLKKGIEAHGIKRDGDHLLIPIRDQAGNLHGVQRIGPAGDKRHNAGASITGHYLLIGEPDPAGRLFVAEGYATAASVHQATGAAVAVAFDCGNLGPVAQALQAEYPAAELVICADDDRWKQPGKNPGVEKASKAAAAVGGVAVVPIFTDSTSQPTDFNDLHRLEGIEAVRAQLAQPEPIPETLEATVERLARLSPLEYDRVREDEAKRLKVRAATLDKEVYRARKGQTDDGEQVTPLVEEVEPWEEPTDGGELLEAIKATLTRHMVLPDGAAVALPLWILGSYAFDAFRIWPKLTITSPEKRCGKSTLLSGLLAPMVHRGLVASSISPAAVFRVIEAWKPTLLIDEADTFLHGNDELRGVINSGHTKSGAFVVRTVGDDHEPKKFSTWAPMAIAMIKTPPGTILDRSVVIQLRRRLPGETAAKLPLGFEDTCLDLRRRCKRWAEDYSETLRTVAPALPRSANDRALDNWTPLLAIAETIGGDWPELARAAFVHLTLEDDDDSIGPMILEDIRRVFTETRRERLHSVELLNNLLELEERPWSEWRHGKPLTSTGLARLLKPFKIKSQQLRINSTNRHGYELAQFRDAFERYLRRDQPDDDCAHSADPPIQNATTLQASNGAGSGRFQSATPGDDVAFQNPDEASNGAGCSVVAFQNGVSGHSAHQPGKGGPGRRTL
ncbi:DUF3631 domain-containing protein [Lamprobacter modestohalophilus]|uniref:DUF3631 domain-containing protein n=1 Tax=Lamprobacter modestohalophilus TaxID=1064514 RepID=UPI002ADED233|nr:DUF3631 domain-containing protein [Lamprobacter modestohalophilus]MEA1048582.1 DUF3631 domain-containing protein [Lamprobacter modestohalophilus]